MGVLDELGIGGKNVSYWSIATLLVFAILVGIFVGFIANELSWGFSTVLNATTQAHEAIVHAVNSSKTITAIYTGKAGNYSYQIDAPASDASFIGNALKYLSYVVPAFITLLTDPKFLVIIIGATLLTIALEMKV